MKKKADMSLVKRDVSAYYFLYRISIKYLRKFQIVSGI